MNRELQKKIEEAIPEFSERARAIAGVDKMVKVNGTRHKLILPGREVGMVYYSVGKENAPLIVGYHGGGFLFGGCALDDDLWQNVTKTLGVNVAAIGYRQGPDHKWKETLADAYDALICLKERSEELGFDGENISVMGQSAGGNLAAAVALKAGMTKEIMLKNEILVYPFLDIYTDPSDKGEGSFAGLGPYVMNYLHCEKEEASDPLCSPYYATDEMIKGLPNTVCAVADNDNLRPEAERYCERLKELGIPVNTMKAPGMPHGYIENGFKKRLHEADFQFLGENAKEIFESGLLRKRSEETLEFIKKYMK